MAGLLMLFRIRPQSQVQQQMIKARSSGLGMPAMTRADDLLIRRCCSFIFC